jgi:Cu(I)/Ag(I) efflux system membrane protein CusA/SilA
MQRIAVPMIGGMLSSTVLTLIVIPAVYGLIKGRRLPYAHEIAVDGPAEGGAATTIGNREGTSIAELANEPS